MNDKSDNVSLGRAILIVLKRRLNLRSLLFFALLISFNSFAWFIYTNKVATGVDVHVKSWNISFEIDNEQLEEEVRFSVSEMFPGMDDYRDEIRIKNVGETDGKLNYELLSVRILDTEYVVSDGGITSDELLNSLKNDYPFTIDIGVTKDGRTLLIECNDAYSLGAYGLEDYKYAKMLSARWSQLLNREDVFDYRKYREGNK